MTQPSGAERGYLGFDTAENMARLELQFRLMPRHHRLQMRNAFAGNNGAKSQFLKKLVAENADLLASLMSKSQLESCRKGHSPQGWNVHHKIPLALGGTNHPDNFVLIPLGPHARIHEKLDPQLLHLKENQTAKAIILIPAGSIWARNLFNDSAARDAALWQDRITRMRDFTPLAPSLEILPNGPLQIGSERPHIESGNMVAPFRVAFTDKNILDNLRQQFKLIATPRHLMQTAAASPEILQQLGFKAYDLADMAKGKRPRNGWVVRPILPLELGGTLDSDNLTLVHHKESDRLNALISKQIRFAKRAADGTLEVLLPVLQRPVHVANPPPPKPNQKPKFTLVPPPAPF